ncbi:hypothetical protein Vadar_015927 [Vaccinium darrowii]|uniref:Uncharacterized protein n=1 Tax=Vaccinium darrowii TaxID=229202 RepID=A0ACB7YWD0_9ERIC|nr:hypothetical protein Vadar_015927 [Vaccinium darrowii]
MSAITIYVDNLSDDMDTEWLGQIFSKYGRVVDVFIPFKRSKNFRSKFGFVRFNTVVEAEKAIADLDGISIRDKKMLVKMATFKVIQNQGGMKKHDTGKVDAKATNPKGVYSEKEAGKSYADAVVGRSCAPRRISVNAIGNEWLTRSVVAKLCSLSAMESIREALHCKGVPQFDVRDMGGLWVVLTFPANSTQKGDDLAADSVGAASSRREVVHGKEVSRVEDSNFEVSEGVKEFSCPKEDNLEDGEIRENYCRPLTDALGEVNHVGPNNMGEVFKVSGHQNLEVVGGFNMVGLRSTAQPNGAVSGFGPIEKYSNELGLVNSVSDGTQHVGL